MTEYEEILEREALALNLSHDKINKLMDALCALAEQHNLSTLWMPVLNDPDDEFLIHLTVEAKADYLVTHNVRHFAAAKQSGINLVAPWDFLAIIRT